MKTFYRFMLAVAFLTVTVSAFAQPRNNDDKKGWYEKMKAEKISFMTAEVGLTPEEAQVFWPIYNQVEEQKNMLTRAVRASYKNLSKAMSEGSSEEEVAALLEEYSSAVKASAEADARGIKAYEKVLPASKVARLILSEEKFRRAQFEKLQGHGHEGQGHGRPGDGGRPQRGERPDGGRMGQGAEAVQPEI